MQLLSRSWRTSSQRLLVPISFVFASRRREPSFDASKLEILSRKDTHQWLEFMTVVRQVSLCKHVVIVPAVMVQSRVLFAEPPADQFCHVKVVVNKTTQAIVDETRKCVIH